MSSSYRWVIVAAGALMTCVALGAMFSLAIFQVPIATETGWSHTGIASAMTLNFIVMGIGGFMWGAASDRFGPRIVVLISAYDWRTAMLIIGIGAWMLLLPAALLVRRAPVTAHEAGASMVADGERPALGKIFRSPQFIVLGLTFFACCAAHSGPIFHMVSYATICGVAPMAAVSIYSVEGLAGLGGRLLYGSLADKFGVKPVLVAGLLVQAAALATYLAVSELGQFYALAVIFGSAYGGVMPLYAILAREYFGPRVIGTVFGAATMLSSIGMAFGPLAGGWILDTYGNYFWLFIGSALVGLGAAAIALAFPPFHREKAQAALGTL